MSSRTAAGRYDLLTHSQKRISNISSPSQSVSFFDHSTRWPRKLGVILQRSYAFATALFLKGCPVCMDACARSFAPTLSRAEQQVELPLLHADAH